MKLQVIDLRINFARLCFGLRLHFHNNRRFDISNRRWYGGFFQFNPHFWMIEPNIFLSSVRCPKFDATASADFKKGKLGRLIRSYRFHPFWKRKPEPLKYKWHNYAYWRGSVTGICSMKKTWYS